MKKTKKLQRNIKIFIKNNWGNFCFLCIFTAFLYVNSLLTNYMMKLQMTNSYNNTPYNAYAITFLIDGQNNKLLDLSNIVNENMLDECVLFKYNPGVQSIYEIIYCSQNAIRFQNAITWDWDFTSKEKLAVVGIDSGYQPGDTILKDGKTYLIKGILERHISEAVNYGIFYTNCSLDSINVQYGYVITSKNYQSLKNAFTKLEEYFQNEEIAIKRIDVRNTEFGDFIRYDKIMLFILICLIFFYILLIFAAKKMWLIYKKPEIFVLTILGAIMPQTKAYLKYLIIWITAFMINTVVAFFTIDTFYFGYSPVLFVTFCILGIVFLSVLPQIKTV